MKKVYSYAPNPFSKNSKNVAKMSVNCTLYLTDEDKSGKKVSSKDFNKRIKEAEKKLIGLFGGYTTVISGKGEYLPSLSKKLMSERIAKVSSFSTEKIYNKKRRLLEEWIFKKKKEWNQETMAFEFEGDLYLIN